MTTLHYTGLLAGLLMLPPLTRLLLRTKAFRGLARPMPEAPEFPRGTGRAVFWSAIVAGGLVACFTYTPMLPLARRMFPLEVAGPAGPLFSLTRINALALWALFNAGAGLLIFFLAYFLWRRRHGVHPAMWGIATTPSELLRTLLLALVLAGAYGAFVFVLRGVLSAMLPSVLPGVSPSEGLPEARLPSLDVLLLVGLYTLLFIPFFFVNALRVNGGLRFREKSEWWSLLRAALASCVGLLLILVIQYGTLLSRGSSYWTGEGPFVDLLLLVVPSLFFLALLNRFFFRLTGRIYLGGMVTSMMFAMIVLYGAAA
ncbi:MAG: hypothetical protein ACE5GJ_06770 [Gemmatimonadota bacterium]